MLSMGGQLPRWLTKQAVQYSMFTVAPHVSNLCSSSVKEFLVVPPLVASGKKACRELVAYRWEVLSFADGIHVARKSAGISGSVMCLSDHISHHRTTPLDRGAGVSGYCTAAPVAALGCSHRGGDSRIMGRLKGSI